MPKTYVSKKVVISSRCNGLHLSQDHKEWIKERYNKIISFNKYYDPDINIRSSPELVALVENEDICTSGLHIENVIYRSSWFKPKIISNELGEEFVVYYLHSKVQYDSSCNMFRYHY